MRQDVCYVVDADVKSVYAAYLKAAQNPPFERSCKQEPFHTISFGVNYSMKYNMNGGSCTLHFIPHGNGTAINLRFSLAQAFGAKCEKYAQYLTDHAAVILGKTPRMGRVDINQFLNDRNKVYEHPPVASQPAATPVAPAPAPAPAAPGIQCSNCGKIVAADAAFCSGCGTKLKKPGGFCTQCGSPVDAGAAFCCKCGKKL